ncbi:hypothetical protein FQN57_005760 [Myotisia sp. PD_48]|nr:hypothetical protein FQN57_005760 [Myotisia sp. PD_48]
MRRLTLQGARWHQHGLHSICFPCSYPRQFAAQRPFSITSKSYDRRKPTVIVRNYEQSIDGKQAPMKVNVDKYERAEHDDVKARLKVLEEELRVYADGPFGPDSDFMKGLSEEDRVKAYEAIYKYALEHKWKEEDERDAEESRKIDEQFHEALERETAQLEDEESQLWDPRRDLEAEEEPLPAPKEPYEVELKVPESHHAYVLQFNKALKILNGTPKLAEKQYAWKAYRRCKEALPFFLEIVPEEALTILWKSQRPESGSLKPSNALHLTTLAEDILSSGRILEPGQWIEYLALLCRNGDQVKALALWRERAPDLETYTPEQTRDYWKLGVDLFVANNCPVDAQDAALIFLSRDPSHNPRILIPVITCWAKTADLNSDIRAWTLYLHLKNRLGDNISMEDYDTLCVGLLNSGKVVLALAVFKDMMLTGQNSSIESRALYQAALGLVGKLHADSITESDVNKVSLGALTILPRKFQNKFFYGSWMKKLIGMGEIDAAAKVVELMYERGVKPDAKHLNGLIGAWLRKGTPEAREKAEGMGWSMIQVRIDNVRAKKAAQDAQLQEPTLVHTEEVGLKIPEYQLRSVPAATIETFSILLLHYTRRSKDDLVNHLIACLDESRIKPNTFFANHLLYRELRKQNILEAWAGYKNMMAAINPDLQTFACLWDCGKIQYDRTRTTFDAGFPSARVLYKEMIDWYSDLTPKNQQLVQAEFSKDLYDHIIRCFCLSLDPEGTIVALRGMMQLFGFFPDAETARILVFLVVRLIPPSEGSLPNPRRRRISATPRAKENVQYVSKLLDKLRDQKVRRLAQQEIYLDDMGPEDHMMFEVNLMCDLLRVVLRSMGRNPAKMEPKIEAVADEMGMHGLDLGEPPDVNI